MNLFASCEFAVTDPLKNRVPYASVLDALKQNETLDGKLAWIFQEGLVVAYWQKGKWHIVPEITTITVEQRSDDYQAFLNGDRTLWESGRHPNDAMGNLIRTHREALHFHIEYKLLPKPGEGPIVENVKQCEFCHGPVDRFRHAFRCRECSSLGDLNTGIMVPPRKFDNAAP